MSKRRFLAWSAGTNALAGALFVVAACSGGPAGEAGMDLGVAPDLAPLPPDLSYSYPAGPYGTDETATVRDFTWSGYFDPNNVAPATKVGYGQVSFDQMRMTGARYALLMTGAFW